MRRLLVVARVAPARCWPAVLFFACVASGIGVAQPSPGAAARGWLPRQIRPIPGLTRAERADAVAKLDAIERLLRQVPELAAPDGFEILPVISGGSRQRGPGLADLPGTVVEYTLSLTFFAPSKAVAGEGATSITVRVNEPQSGTLTDREGRAIYIEGDRARPPRGTPEQVAATLWQVPHATQVYGELWAPARDVRAGRGERSAVTALFVTAGDLPWLPVSRETFYQAVLMEQEGADGQKLAGVRTALTKTPYEQWMADAPERKKIRDDIVSTAANSQSAAEVEKLRRRLEADEREVAERLQRTEAEDRERHAKSLAGSLAQRDAFDVELKGMTPDERRMPAYLNNALEEGPIATGWRQTADPAPPAWRVLTPNYDFWRARRSPVEVRSISVTITISGTGLRPKVRRALLQTFQTLDWAAINRLLENPR